MRTKHVMQKTDKIYVAGHNGLVGSAIVRKLKKEGFTNIVTRSHKELDLTDQAMVQEFFEQEKPDFVFMAAAKVGGIQANREALDQFMYINTMIEFNTIMAAFHTGVKKFCFLGSGCIYPRDCPQPIKEEYLLTSENLKFVCQLIDIRHEPMASDVEMFRWLVENNIPVLIVATKADKIGKNARQKQIALIKRSLGVAELSVLPYSSLKNERRSDLLDVIGSILVE